MLFRGLIHCQRKKLMRRDINWGYLTNACAGIRVHRMLKWLRAIKQTTAFLGLLTIVSVWTGVFLLAYQERDRASQDAVQKGRNLARVFDEYISRVIK